jgi:phage tail-like protein
MDANGLRFWMLASAQDWRGLENAAFDPARRSLRLAATRAISPAGAETRPQAQARLAAVPQALDEFGSAAWWDAGSASVRVRSRLPEAAPAYTPPPGAAPTDLAVGFDGVLYLAVDGGVVMADLRDRWAPLGVPRDAAADAAGFNAWRLAADPAGGAWAIDGARGLLARVQGLPFPDRPQEAYSATTFRPAVENPGAPRLALWTGVTAGAGEQLVALAASPSGRLGLLFWRADQDAYVRVVEDGHASAPRVLRGARSPYSIAFVSETRVAVLIGGLSEAPAYELPAEAAQREAALELEACGDLYPLAQHDGGPFAHALSLPPCFGLSSGESRALHRVSLPTYEKRGEGRNYGAGVERPFDGGSPETCWHRLYLEAAFPPGCGAVVWLATGDTRRPPAAGDERWQPHVFGNAPMPPAPGAVPRAAWLSQPSEIPFHPGLLHCPPVPQACGLFTALIQRAAGETRSLRGRYLWVRVELHGDGRSTPDIAAVRAYASRFSYVQQYLPELYREASGDFLERFVGNFEGVLTALEDKVAAAYVLTHPAAAPEPALPWLASWIDALPPPAMPAARCREWLKAAPYLQRRRGTPGGLRLALELATGGRMLRVPTAALGGPPAAPGGLVAVRTRDEAASLEALLLSSEGAGASGEVALLAGGAVSGGELVVLEDFRLRRAVATILGADLADEQDPLLPGLTVSGNSVVGDTLMLGEEERKEFLALFAADLPLSPGEERAVEALYEQLAHRVTVLAHQELEPVDLGLVRAVAAAEAPAHVEVRVVAARYPFLTGIASLVGVDTYLAPKPPRAALRVDASAIGARDYVMQAAALDPRVAGAPPRRVPNP